MGTFPFPRPPGVPRPSRDPVAPAAAWIADHRATLPDGWVLVVDGDTGVVEVQWRKRRHTAGHAQDTVAGHLAAMFGTPDTSTRVGVAIWPATNGPTTGGRRPALVVEGVTVR